MKRLILSLLLIIYSVTAWCQYPHSHIQDLQHVAQVTLPDTPTVRHTKRGLVYSTTYDGVIYTTSASVINTSFGDIIRGTPLDSIYMGAVKGITKSTGGTLIYKKDIVVQGVKGMEFETGAVENGTNFYLFYRIFYFNDKLLMQGMWFRETVQRNDNRINTFFDTFKLTINPADVKQGTGIIVFTAVKYALIIILALAVIIALIVFLARRSHSKTQQ